MPIKLRKILTLACAEQYRWAKGNCAKTQLRVTLIFFKGWGGPLISPRPFTQRAFDTPECALIIDDICLSGQLEVNNIKIRLTKDDGIRTTGRQNKLVRPAGKKKSTGSGGLSFLRAPLSAFGIRAEFCGTD
ncbi:MAG: hypothetical protein HN863_06725 [Marinovum sp.]|nr:hypothetical protein [Marinovum sp.]